MKELIITGLGIVAFACGDSGNTSTDKADNDVEQGSGEAVSPQLETDSATDARLEVDTVSSAQEIDQQ